MAAKINCYICEKPAQENRYGTNYEINCPNCDNFFVASTCISKFKRICVNLTQGERDVISKKIKGAEFDTANIDILFRIWLLRG